MLARRLLVVMIVLLGISTVAAILVPPPPRQSTTTATDSTSTEPPARQAGELVRERVSADANERETVRLELRDQLALNVRSKRFRQIRIPRLGLLGDAAPGSPARFDILAQQEGTFEVVREGGHPVAKVVVASGSGRRAGRSADTSR